VGEVEKKRLLQKFQNLLLKDELEVWNTYPRGRPPSLCQIHHHQKLAEADLRVRDNRQKSKKALENTPMQLYLEDLQPNLARDPEFYQRQPESACMRHEFLESWA
jgi:hypothetical protein